MTRRTLTASLLFPLVLLLASAGPALAECTGSPTFPAMRYAFIADVTQFAYGNDRTSPDREWSVEMDVERTFRGSLPARLTATGIEVGCAFNGIEVRTGERLFIAAPDVDPNDPWLIRGEIFLWREVADGRWEFYADALQDGALGFPAAVVDADTIEEILAVVGVPRAPETATTLPAVERGLPSLAILAGVFVLSLAAGVARPGGPFLRRLPRRLCTR